MRPGTDESFLGTGVARVRSPPPRPAPRRPHRMWKGYGKGGRDFDVNPRWRERTFFCIRQSRISMGGKTGHFADDLEAGRDHCLTRSTLQTSKQREIKSPRKELRNGTRCERRKRRTRCVAPKRGGGLPPPPLILFESKS
ncbi:hypothetical protein NL676_031504 [Syzygium grande]|nr:hypothetical protein NL676_031504 [Syzygium grande]